MHDMISYCVSLIETAVDVTHFLVFSPIDNMCIDIHVVEIFYLQKL